MAISNYISQLRQMVGNDLLHVPSVTILTFDEQGRVLLVKDMGSGQWTTAGGAIDPGEYPADAAVREMWEETGLLVDLSRITGIYGGNDYIITYPNGDRTSYLMTVFEAVVVNGRLQPDLEEVSAVAYFSQEELAQMPLTPWHRQVLADAFAQRQQAGFQQSNWQPPSDGIRTGGMSDYMRQIRAKVGRYEMMMPTVGTIVLNEAGDILLQKRADNGRWAPPAGAIEPDESPTNAAVRETWEETGVIVKPERITGYYTGPDYDTTYSPSGDRAVIYSVIYLCYGVGGRPQPDRFESTDVAYFPKESLTEELLGKRWWKRLNDALDGKTAVYFHPPSWQPPAVL